MLLRLIKYSLKNILRNKFLSFSSVVVLGLLMFFVNILMILHNLSNNLIEVVNSKLSISLYLKDTYPFENPDVQKLLENIKSQVPNVKLTLKTKEEVLEEMRKKDPELVKIIMNKNPLPSTISITNIAIEQYETLNHVIENKLYILSDFKTSAVYNYRTQYERIIKIITILKTLKLALYVIILVFLLSIFIITYSIIGNFIYHYRDEIYITKLVWWNNSFIYGPFIFQWMIYSLLGFLLSTNIFIILVNNVRVLFEKQEVTSMILSADYQILLAIQVWIFLTIGAVSAYLSTRKYMKD